MKPIELLEQLSAGRGRIAFIATYEFDPAFFEMRLLRNTMLETAQRIVVFMDHSRYQELVRSGFNGKSFNREYLVLPVRRAAGAFHPKLYLIVGDRTVEGVVGSNNCTGAGFAYNLELCSIFSTPVANEEVPDRSASRILTQIYQVFRRILPKTDPFYSVLEEHFFRPTEALCSWLLKRPAASPSSDIDLLHSYDRSLWDQVKARLDGKTVERVTIMAPFFDQDLKLVKRIARAWPKARLTVVAQQGYATLDGRRLAKLFNQRSGKLMAAEPTPGRRLHAKAFMFETRRETFWLSGSPNASSAAFDGANAEAAIWLRSDERPALLLEHDDMRLSALNPAEFVSGTTVDASAGDRAENGLSIEAAVVEPNGALRCALAVIGSLQSVRLVLRNQAEPLPLFAWPLTSRSSHEVQLRDDQLQELRGTVTCELQRGRGEHVERSDPVSLVQLFHIVREKGSSVGSRNPLRRIEDTGENLVDYVDGLGSLREAIEFFNNCNIRFKDGEGVGSGAPRSEPWTPRNPFKPDTPPGWSANIVGSSAEELRTAVLAFVQRHQNQKLEKHIRRGNINGLGNFLDIFRTLNTVLLTYHRRNIRGEIVMPVQQVTAGITLNLSLLIGPLDGTILENRNEGFVASVLENLGGDDSLVRERLGTEGVPQMLRAAVHAMIDARATAHKLTGFDHWAARRLGWVTDWMTDLGLSAPTPEEIAAAELEYHPAPRRARQVELGQGKPVA